MSIPLVLRGLQASKPFAFLFCEEPNMARMKAVQVDAPNKELKVVERDIPEPGPRQVRIKVEACGVCHSDMFTVAGAWPGIHYPRVPGHEIVGVIDAVGPD